MKKKYEKLGLVPSEQAQLSLKLGELKYDPKNGTIVLLNPNS